eukprot:gene19247-21175_t
MDELLSRHKCEQKELLAKTLAMKHSVPKGDKKKKKQVLGEIALLEAELTTQHEAEIKEFHKQEDSTERVEKHSDCLQQAELKENSDDKPRKSKAQKRRERKEEEERERAKRLAEAEIENKNSARNVEAEQLSALLLRHGLRIKEIPPDGNCLYNAIADQLANSESQLDWKTLRSMTASQMRDRKDEFLPFMVHASTGEPYTSDEFYEYCEDLEGTNAWGGHLEIQALSKALKVTVEIFQANSPVLKIGEDFSDDSNTIRISYHRHAYGLGEHYNSVVQKEDDGKD